MRDKKKKQKLPFFRTIKKTFVFYLKNIVYIFILNGLYLKFAFNPIKNSVHFYLAPLFNKISFVNNASFFITLGLLVVLKITLLTGTSDNFNKKVSNDVSMLVEQMLMRFFAVFATTLLVLALVGFGTTLFVVPGVICLIYLLFAPFLSAVRVKKTGHIKGNKILMGASALARSYELIKGNFIRLLVFNVIFLILTFFIYAFAVDPEFLNLSLMAGEDINIVSYVISDLIILFNICAMLNMEEEEKKKIDDSYNKYNSNFVFKSALV